jgi:glutathione S-transferase
MLLYYMRTLYHHPICPLSRQVRVYLKELDLSFELVKEDYWQRRSDFIKLNPSGMVPVLIENSGLNILGIYPITEYLYDKYPNFVFMDEDSEVKCEIRRLLNWFNDKFYREVTKILVDEKVVRLLCNLGGPRTDFLRAFKSNLTQHIKYLSSLLEKHDFLISKNITCADIAAACHLSVIDYFGEIYWEQWTTLHNWYAILKSRPSFRPLLKDYVAGFAPAAGYSNLDF